MKKHGRIAVEQLEDRKLLSITPNDPGLSSQWSLNSMSLSQAWLYSTGSKDVVVAVIDSGIDLTHSDLKNNIWKNIGEIAGNGIDDENNGYIDDVNGWNFYDNTNNVQDNYGHGTHVAGIIGAEGNNGVGIVGVNWHVSIMPLKFMNDSGAGWTSGALAAIDYVLMMKKNFGVNVVVVNNSWSAGYGYSSVMNDRIKSLNDANIVFVAAAGNNATDNDLSPSYPGSYNQNNVINVGSFSNETLSLTRSSNYGKTSVDLAAPGYVIFSTLPRNSYGYLSGTSMAAPQVAGAVALLNSIKKGITVSEVRSSILDSVDKMPGLVGKVVTEGELNVAAAIFKALGTKYNSMPVGGIYNTSMTMISGWATDNNRLKGGLSVRLFIDGVGKDIKLTDSNNNFVFNLGGLTVGSHVIKIRAQDVESGMWVVVGKSTVSIPAPMGNVGLLSLTKIRGWAFSARSGASPVVVRILINGKVVTTQWANQYRAALLSTVGSSYHGFSVSLSGSWFQYGSNVVSVQVLDPISNQISLIWSGTISK
jgi:hypothetical protein